VLLNLSKEELSHYLFWKKITKIEIAPNGAQIFFYNLLSRIFGLTFSLKLMEKGEELSRISYEKLVEIDPGVNKIIQDEMQHENSLIDLIDEEKLKYLSSIVLGLNDALVELTGALAGLTLALQNTRLIAVVGLITGIAASMSMSVSEYLSSKHEITNKSPLKASLFTGTAYIFTVTLLIAPYLIFDDIIVSFCILITNALLILVIFNFFVAIAKGFSFRKRFFEMAALSLSIAAINFLIGYGIKHLFNLQI
jgi:VIT1/CCC1 family predicted Fe2+/Mn2+ transporter